jgi:hypothetical protein
VRLVLIILALVLAAGGVFWICWAIIVTSDEMSHARRHEQDRTFPRYKGDL